MLEFHAGSEPTPAPPICTCPTCEAARLRIDVADLKAADRGWARKVEELREINGGLAGELVRLAAKLREIRAIAS
jgi:hypothetical protein